MNLPIQAIPVGRNTGSYAPGAGVNPSAVCANATVNGNQVCFNLPIAGQQCFTSPVSIPFGAKVEACGDTCSPAGIKVAVTVNGAQIWGSSYGYCW
jgi:hypothetical protein